MTLRLRLFGPPDITINDISVVEQMSSKAQAILYYLAATDKPQRRTTLASLLWGDAPEAAARANLRRALIDLRESVADYLVIERNSIAFQPGSRYWIDLAEFKVGVSSPSSRIDPRQLQAAVELYHGDFLEGFYVRGAPDFESWVLAAAAQTSRREAHLPTPAPTHNLLPQPTSLIGREEELAEIDELLANPSPSYMITRP